MWILGLKGLYRKEGFQFIVHVYYPYNGVSPRGVFVIMYVNFHRMIHPTYPRGVSCDRVYEFP